MSVTPSKIRVSLQNKNFGDPIDVFCRVKPSKRPGECSIEVVGDTEIRLTSSARERAQHTARFKKVFFRHSQQELYSTFGQQAVYDLLHGQDTLIFAYGVSGTGKTYSLSGSDAQPGITPRLIWNVYESLGRNSFALGSIKCDGTDIVMMNPDQGRRHVAKLPYFPAYMDCGWRSFFDCCSLKGREGLPRFYKFAVFVSFLEIYDNNVYDLLSSYDPNQSAEDNINNKKRARLAPRQLYSFSSAFSQAEVQIDDVDRAYTAYCYGKSCSHVGSTGLNKSSTRGHLIFTMRVAVIPGYDNTYKELDYDNAVLSQISVCDLAGIERVKKSMNEGDRLKETGYIHKSLGVLHRCILTLKNNQANFAKTNRKTEKKRTFSGLSGAIVPYRESELTSTLKEFFEGSGKICMLVCLSESSDSLHESFNVLDFAEMSSKVVTTPAKQDFLEKKKTIVKALEEQVKSRGEMKSSKRYVEVESAKPYKINSSELDSDNLTAQAQPPVKTHHRLHQPKNQNIQTQNTDIGVPICPPFKVTEGDNKQIIPRFVEYLKQTSDYYKRNQSELISKLNQIKSEYKSVLKVYNEAMMDENEKTRLIEVYKANMVSLQSQYDNIREQYENAVRSQNQTEKKLTEYKNSVDELTKENIELQKRLKMAEEKYRFEYEEKLREMMKKYGSGFIDSMTKMKAIRNIVADKDYEENDENLHKLNERYKY